MFFWQVIRIFDFLSLSTDSRYLQSEPLNYSKCLTRGKTHTQTHVQRKTTQNKTKNLQEFAPLTSGNKGVDNKRIMKMNISSVKFCLPSHFLWTVHLITISQVEFSLSASNVVCSWSNCESINVSLSASDGVCSGVLGYLNWLQIDCTNEYLIHWRHFEPQNRDSAPSWIDYERYSLHFVHHYMWIFFDRHKKIKIYSHDVVTLGDHCKNLPTLSKLLVNTSD